MAEDAAPRARRGGGHDAHDPETIVALLDRDLPAVERATGEALMAACHACAELHADLLALATAGASMRAVATRPRDFTLSPAQAAALRAGTTTREPVPAGARLSGEMTGTPPNHSDHDRLLIASFADRSVSETDRSLAGAQIAGCGACARLHSDLVALAAATRSLPTPARPREFTLTPEDADRLRIRGWRRILSIFGSAGDAFSRPLAIGLTTLGLAGLLVGTVPALVPMGAPASMSTAGAPQERAAGEGAAGAAPGAAALPPEPLEAPAPTQPADPGDAAASSLPAALDPLLAEASEEPDQLFAGAENTQLDGEPDATRDLFGGEPTGPSPMLIVALLLLLSGLALFVLRWAGRRAAAS